jgi:NADP-dependent 3-hydroxy acid dehydrogenase YdfG
MKSKIAVVTGAGSGIGAALCEELARRGARVVAADLDERAAAETARSIRIAGGTATHAAVDVTSAPAVAELVAATERTGPIALWCSNAGIAVGGAADALELADWQRVLDVNLAGVVHGVHAVYPRMVARRAGHIVNIASVAGLAPYPLALPYTTSKHAVVGLSLALRAEAAHHRVRVSVACPGMIRTPIWERSTVRGSLAHGRAAMMSRLAGMTTPEACARAIVRGVLADRAVIPVTLEARVAWWLTRASPALALALSKQLARAAHRIAGRPTSAAPVIAAAAEERENQQNDDDPSKGRHVKTS